MIPARLELAHRGSASPRYAGMIPVNSPVEISFFTSPRYAGMIPVSLPFEV